MEKPTKYKWVSKTIFKRFEIIIFRFEKASLTVFLYDLNEFKHKYE